MPNDLTPLELTRRLLAFRTVNPPGDEDECGRYLGGLLTAAGLEVTYHAFAERRTSLVATLAAQSPDPPLCFSGHLDTVPLGDAPWSQDPFGGQLVEDRLYGRGAADMKGGLAAMVLALCRAAQGPPLRRGLRLILTAGEERACEGACHLAELPGVLGPAGALLVAEPTGNRPIIGHKGALWLKGSTRGVTAHGSTPQAGDNAIYKAARAALILERFQFQVPPDPLLGPPTLNLGTMRGGLNINSVPDRAELEIDIRTIPALPHAPLRAKLARLLGPEVELEVLVDRAGFASDPDAPWIRQLFRLIGERSGRVPLPAGVAYFTDASVLRPPLGDPPTVICGPGEALAAHTTDEFCSLSQIEEALAIYAAVIDRWQAL